MEHGALLLWCWGDAVCIIGRMHVSQGMHVGGLFSLVTALF